MAWETLEVMSGFSTGISAQRYGNPEPKALTVDTVPAGSSDGNGVFEPGESVDVRPVYRNINGLSQTVSFTGDAGFGGPGGDGVVYYLHDAAHLAGRMQERSEPVVDPSVAAAGYDD